MNIQNILGNGKGTTLEHLTTGSCKMRSFIKLTTRASLAGLGALAFCKLVDFSSRKAVAAIALGCLVSTPATLIGAGSYGIYKAFSNGIQAVSSRSLSGVAVAFATFLTGWILLNNAVKISCYLSEKTKCNSLGLLEENIHNFSQGAANWFQKPSHKSQ